MIFIRVIWWIDEEIEGYGLDYESVYWRVWKIYVI